MDQVEQHKPDNAFSLTHFCNQMDKLQKQYDFKRKEKYNFYVTVEGWKDVAESFKKRISK